MRIRFGPSGLPDLGGLGEGLRALKEMGFDACEFDFVREFWIDKETASGARKLIQDLGISVRAHAPFYGVLSQDDPRKVKMAVAMMHHTANLVHLMGGEGITPSRKGHKPHAFVTEKCFAPNHDEGRLP